MKLRYRILGGLAALAAVALVSLAVAISHDSPCGSPVPLPRDTQRMKAIVHRCYGSPDVLRMEEIAKPTASDDDLLVKVHSASLNPFEWHFMRGSPYLMRLLAGLGSPEDPRIGTDFAGTVEAVGRNVTRFKPGDEVFGGGYGALAEYITIRQDRAVILKPANLTFEQAAAVPIAAITALQALRDEGRIQPGHKVLINGASGGVGTFAVQIAKALGAEVTGVCSTRNVDMVRSLGADHVIDYTQEDFAQSDQRYDLIVDNVANHSLSEYRRVLTEEGALVIVGGTSRNPWIGPMLLPLKAKLMSPFISQKAGTFMAEFKRPDFEFLNGLMQSGKVTPVIDRRYAFAEVAAAMRYLEEGHARGKVVVNLP